MKLLAQSIGHDRARCFLNQLLIAALHGLVQKYFDAKEGPDEKNAVIDTTEADKAALLKGGLPAGNRALDHAMTALLLPFAHLADGI